MPQHSNLNAANSSGARELEPASSRGSYTRYERNADSVIEFIRAMDFSSETRRLKPANQQEGAPTNGIIKTYDMARLQIRQKQRTLYVFQVGAPAGSPATADNSGGNASVTSVGAPILQLELPESADMVRPKCTLDEHGWLKVRLPVQPTRVPPGHAPPPHYTKSDAAPPTTATSNRKTPLIKKQNA